MKYLRLSAKLVAILTLFSLIAPQSAYAYLDPGTGSYFLQLALGVLVGSLFAVKIFWKNIKGFFVNFFSKEQKDEKGNG